jgi:DNA modification methylase
MNDINSRNYEQYMKEVFMDTFQDKWNKDLFRKYGDRKFQGNFMPDIVKNCLLRYTKENDEFLDPCAGSGTSIDIADLLKRKCVAYDLTPIRKDILKGDITKLKLNKKFKLIIFHPPYAGIVRFSDKNEDLSNVENGNEFLIKIEPAVKNLIEHLEVKGWLCLVIGDYYLKGEWFPLGFKLMELFQKYGLILKSINVKNSPDRANFLGKNYKLWCYRHLKFGTYFFKHEYIMFFKRQKINKKEIKKRVGEKLK